MSKEPFGRNPTSSRSRQPQVPDNRPTGWSRSDKQIFWCAAAVFVALIGAALWMVVHEAPRVAQVRQLARGGSAKDSMGTSATDEYPVRGAAVVNGTDATELEPAPQEEMQNSPDSSHTSAAVTLQPGGNAVVTTGAATRDSDAGEPTTKGGSKADELTPLVKELRDFLVRQSEQVEPTDVEPVDQPPAAGDGQKFHHDQRSAVKAAPNDLSAALPASLKNRPTLERLNYEQDLRTMLALGMKSKDPSALEQSRQKFDAAKRRCSDDPRLYYAFGLVLLEHGQMKGAREEFLSAGRTGDGLFLPGWQAAVWVRLAENDPNAGASILFDLVGRLAQISGPAPTPEAKARCAAWIGRTVGFLCDGEFDAERNSPNLAETRERLPADLRSDFDRGRDDIRQRLALLRRQAARPPEDLARDTQLFLEALTTDAQLLKQQVQELETELQEADQIVKDAAADAHSANRSLKKLRSEATRVQEWVAVLSQPQVHYEKEKYDEPVKDKNGKHTGEVERRTRMVEREETSAERSERLAQLRQAQERAEQIAEQLNAVQAAQSGVARSGKQVKPTLTSKRRAITEARRRLARTELQIKLLSDDPPTPQSLIARSQSLAAVEPFVPKFEKDRLLQSLHPSDSK
jgi:hypothetical protein